MSLEIKKELAFFHLNGSFCHTKENEECNNLGKPGSYYYTIRSELEKKREAWHSPGFQSYTEEVILGLL